MRSRTWLWALVAAVPTAFSLGACGDDEPSTTGPSSSSSGQGASGATGAVGGEGGVGAEGGSGGSGGVGGTGGAPPTVEGADACPGAAIQLGVGDTVTGVGDTSTATDDYTTFCGDTTAEPDTGDVVFEVTTTEAGTLHIVLDDAAGFDGVVSLRRQGCLTREPSDECVNQATDGEDHQTDVAPGTYWLVVDGQAGSQGAFSMNVSLAAAECGDGVINTSIGEQCDPVVPDETCFAPGHPTECTLQPPPVLDLETCPGYDVTINLGDDLVLGEFNTTTYADNHLGTCAAGNMGGRDNVFHFKPNATGTLTLTFGNHPSNGMPWCDMCGMSCVDGDGCWAPILYVRTGACEQATGVEVGCAYDATFVDTTPTVTVPVTEFLDYWVFVDSTFNGPFTAGPYYLEASLD